MAANLLAWTALFAWPAVALAVFAARRRRAPLARTTAWMMLLPAMFLPSNLTYKIPLVPGLDKHRLSFLAIAVSLYLFHRRELRGRLPHRRLAGLLTGILLLGVIGTVRTNPDALTFGPTVLPGLTSWDIVSAGAGVLLDVTLPFAVGQLVFRTERDLRDLLEVLTICGLIYVPLNLLEVRLSPQLHFWVYGYYPSDFVQALRGGGYRPIVFMNHGLSVAMFMFTTFAAALGLWRARRRLPQLSSRGRAAAIAVVLLLSKSLGALLYATAAVPLRMLASSRALARTLVVVSLVVLSYPLARSADLVPTEGVISVFNRIDPARAASLAFRLRNEDALVRRAMLRPVFGWGYWARSHIWADWGEDISVTDGYWIIQLGGWGLVGFVAAFAFPILPILSYARGRARLLPGVEPLLGALALIVTLSTLDLLPNARSDDLPLAYAGALLTLATTLRRPRRAREELPPEDQPGSVQPQDRASAPASRMLSSMEQ